MTMNTILEAEKNHKKIVMVVEDDPTILSLYEHAFNAEGFKTYLAHDGEEGLKLIKDKNPDLVILDILMPKVNGIEVLGQLRKEESTKNLPVLVLTNYDTYRAKAMEYGIVDYLIKADVTLKDVMEKVNAILKKGDAF